MANYLYFQPSLVEYFAKQKLGSISKLLAAIEKDGSWWYRSKAKPTIKLHDVVQIKAENNQSVFSDMIGLTKGQVSNILNKKHAPGFHTLSRIIRAFPDISARWLLTGEGSVVSNEREDQSLRELVKSKDEIIGLLKNQLQELKKQ